MHLFIEFEPFCQKLWAFVPNFASFTMSTHQIGPCHVTQVRNFEIFLRWPNSAFNFSKSNKISSGKVLYFRSYEPKTSRQGWKILPVPLGLRYAWLLLLPAISTNCDKLIV